MRGVTRPGLVRALWVGTRAVLIIRRIIPIRTPLMYLPGHASYPRPTHISRIACCRSRSLHLRDMLRQPRGRRKVTTGAAPSAVQPGTPGGMRVKGETRDLISTAAPSSFPGSAPGEVISLRPTRCILPFRFCWESHRCPLTIGRSIFPGERADRQEERSWTRMAIEPGNVLFGVNRLIKGSRIPGLLHKANILRNRDQIAVHPEARDLDLLGKECASYPSIFFQPVVIPIIPVPEAADFTGITSHDKGATRNPNQLSAIFYVLSYCHLRLPS